MISAINLWTTPLLFLSCVWLSCLNADVAALQETYSSFGAVRRFKLSLEAGDAEVHPDLKIEKRSPAEVHVSTTGGEALDFDINNSQFVQQMADFILNLIRSHIISQHKRQVDIPDIHKSSCKGLGFLCVTIAFNATQGWFRDMSSIRRVGDVKVFRNEENITIDFEIGLNNTQFGYDKYKLKVGAIELSGKINGEMGLTSVRVKFSMDVGRQTCSIFLLDTKISYLGEPKLHLTGMGQLNTLYSKMMTWVAKRAGKSAVTSAEGVLRNTIQDVFQRLRCEEDLAETRP